MRLFLHQRRRVPNQMVAPGAGARRRVAVDDRAIDAFRLAPLELFLQRSLRVRALREDDEAGGIAIDAVDDERPSLTADPQIPRELVVRRSGVAPPLERHGEQPRRL